MKVKRISAAAAIAAFSSGAEAQSLNTFGMPGLIDMPSAHALPDATIAGTIAGGGSDRKVSLTFQMSERLTASFRYADLQNWSVSGQTEDLSFDIQFLLLK